MASAHDKRPTARTAKKRHKKTPYALPGTVTAEYTRCGKTGCKCTRGALHGPYYVRRWKAAGRQHRVYVRACDLSAVRRACAIWHQIQYDERQQMREALRYSRMDAAQLIREIRRIEREIIGPYRGRGA